MIYLNSKKICLCCKWCMEDPTGKYNIGKDEAYLFQPYCSKQQWGMKPTDYHSFGWSCLQSLLWNLRDYATNSGRDRLLEETPAEGWGLSAFRWHLNLLQTRGSARDEALDPTKVAICMLPSHTGGIPWNREWVFWRGPSSAGVVEGLPFLLLRHLPAPLETQKEYQCPLDISFRSNLGVVMPLSKYKTRRIPHMESRMWAGPPSDMIASHTWSG